MLFIVLVLVSLALARIYFILPQSHRQPRRKDETCSLAVFLGSGGHTAEALTLVSALDFQRYKPRTYVVSEGDILSVKKAADLEKSKHSEGQYRILVIPRARRVHQSLLTTPPSALLSLISCIYYVVVEPLVAKKPAFADLLLLNGPGTCFVLCIAVYMNKFLGLSASKIIYVESFARVKKLSLSGRLLLPLVDRFFVQWPQLLRDGGREEYHGQLI
ncbi:glycosyltransferase family 1 protein [Amanita rubescens]|nr:glycosyltransferase family 1 protein [Amanita rubescens]